MERRLAAILAADVVGYSRLMAEDEAGTLLALTDLRKTAIEPLIAKHHGRVVKLMGDGILVEFASVVDAVACAVAWQSGPGAFDGDKSLRFRIGVNLGDVISQENDIYGDGVNVAARLQAIADPGGVMLSATVLEHIQGRVSVSTEDRGEVRLKNIDRPVHVYAVNAPSSMAAADTGAQLKPVTAPATDRPSIAVLPFTNMSGNPEQEYFSDGVTEDIITDLSRVSALLVIARNTSFTFKGRAVEIGQAARQMKVSYILEGSVRKSGGRVRINAQLIDARSGGHVWAERYDRDFGDIFALQDEISKSVVAALKIKLLPEELKIIADRSTTNAEAYRYYLLGRSLLFGAFGSRPALYRAREMFEKAIVIDPSYARAYAGLADCDANLWAAGDSSVSVEEMLSNSSRALESAPHLAETHASKGYALYLAGYADRAVEVLKRALELDPNLYEAHWHYGEACREAGRHVEAIAPLERAVELRPMDIWPISMLSAAYLELGRKDESIQARRRALACIEANLQQRPDNANALALGATDLCYFHEQSRADEWARRAIAIEPDNFAVRYNVACCYAAMNKLDTALEHLDYIHRHIPRARRWLFGIAKIDSDFAVLRQQPAFQALMARIEAELTAQ